MPIRLFLLFMSFFLMSFIFKKTPVEYSAAECAKVSSFLCKKFNFVQIGSGGSAFNGIISYETFRFKKIGCYSIAEARKMLLESAEVYLKAMNSCEKIRHAMVKYPFDEMNCSIGIFFYNSDESDVLYPHPSYACFIEGKLVYYFYKNLNNKINNEVEFVETYQEALERAKEH